MSMTQQEQATNLQENIHREDYDGRFNLQNLNHQTMIFARGRKRESLNGAWQFTPDLFDTGLRANWNVLEKRDSAGHSLPWDYDYQGGERMPVPSCWNLFKPEYCFYEGSAWYCREFDYREATPGERLFLRVGAAHYDAKVFLNQEFLGNHYGGSTPFCVELTGKAQPGRNILQICVNNSRTTDRVPMRNVDWFPYGGIYRDVELIRTPAHFIKECFVYLVPDGTYRQIRAKIIVDDPAARGEITFCIPELALETVQPFRDGCCEFTVEAQPELWSPGHPKLYEVQAAYRDDRISDRVGFRQISVADRTIRCNGEKLFLRGVCVHEDDLQLGKATNEADIRRRFADAKELGCNFLRLTHYPHSELVAELADEAGIMLWEELPVYWAIDFANPSTYRDAENQLQELIRRDRNRCSVIIWSVGNENPDTDARLQFMGDLVKTAKAEDPSRLVSAACLVNPQALRIEDRLAALLDVIGINEYYGWYRRDMGDLIQLGRNSNPDKPVIITETGADALAGYFDSGEEALFSEDFMARVYENQLAILRKIDYIQGMTPWLLYDFRSPRRMNRFQQGFNRKGLIAEDKKTRKKAFYILRDFYKEMSDE